jgi:hypothetical protein
VLNRNGTPTTTTRTTPPAVEGWDPRTELHAWDAITTLDAALEEATIARLHVEQLTDTLERLEASVVLSIEGGNAETRRARLTLALADDARYQTEQERLRYARRRLLEAERQATVVKERCRLLRASLALADDR